jgi:hypothetical protein
MLRGCCKISQYDTVAEIVNDQIGLLTSIHPIICAVSQRIREKRIACLLVTGEKSRVLDLFFTKSSLSIVVDDCDSPKERIRGKHCIEIMRQGHCSSP